MKHARLLIGAVFVCVRGGADDGEVGTSAAGRRRTATDHGSDDGAAQAQTSQTARVAHQQAARHVRLLVLLTVHTHARAHRGVTLEGGGS